MTSYKIAFTVFAKPTLITILLTLFNGAMRTAIKADFLSSKSFLLKTIVNKGITRDFRSLFVTYAGVLHYAGVHVLEVWSLQRYIIPAFLYITNQIYLSI